jgi:hypothetical protein
MGDDYCECMKQILMDQAAAPVSPVCEQCGAPTRLVGLEPHPTDAATDLLTHMCRLCERVQTTTLMRRPPNGH